jgi:hypothetical protein
MGKGWGGSRRKRFYRIEGNKKIIPMTPEAKAVFERQLEAFRVKFGRDPEPQDPVFFDPDADTPTQISEAKGDQYWRLIIGAAAKVGIDPAKIYAMHKTGRIVTEDNTQFLTDDELQEWNDAIDEYHEYRRRGAIQ